MTRLTDVQWLRDHTAAYRSDPETAHDWDTEPVGGTGIVPTLLLTTTGRRSGQPRATPLLYQPCGVGFVVVASRGGSHHNPAWFENLRANPACTVRAGRFSYRATARVLSGDDRRIQWERMARFWPDYESYQARTEREIPVVILDAEPDLP